LKKLKDVVKLWMLWFFLRQWHIYNNSKIVITCYYSVILQKIKHDWLQMYVWCVQNYDIKYPSSTHLQYNTINLFFDVATYLLILHIFRGDSCIIIVIAKG
jgi:hypothetical protein